MTSACLVVLVSMWYRKEGGCLKQYASGFLCTCATHSQVAVMENFMSVCRTRTKKEGIGVGFRAVEKKIGMGVWVKLEVI